MKKAIILVTMMTFCLASGAALAKKPAPAPVGPDWDAAYEFGALVSTDTDENGVVWQTFYDQAQDLMWTQTAGATKTDVLASIEAGSVPLDEEGFVAEGALSAEALGGGIQPMAFCAFIWPTPYDITLYDDNPVGQETTAHYYASTAADLVSSTGTVNTWQYTVINFLMNDVDGYIQSRARTIGTNGYCATNYNQYRAYPGSDSPQWMNTNNGYGDYDTCSVSSGNTYYRIKEDSHVNGGVNWSYPNDDEKFARHIFYACDYWRYLEVTLISYPM